MSLRFIVVCAALAVASCARVDQEQLARQVQQQQEMAQQQNEQIREHHRVENQQRLDQMRDLEDQRRHQEQIIRDHEHRIRDNVEHVYVSSQPRFTAAPHQYYVIPSSARNFEYRDDSNYNFAYAVNDLTTGDMKSQKEVRQGDQVLGQYTMMDSDGYQRIVDYRADDKNGFDAEVRRTPMSPIVQAQHVQSHYVPQYYSQPASRYVAFRPAIYASTSVSRLENNQRNQYTTSTASNF